MKKPKITNTVERRIDECTPSLEITNTSFKENSLEDVTFEELTFNKKSQEVSHLLKWRMNCSRL